jgi:hypothetical protein
MLKQQCSIDGVNLGLLSCNLVWTYKLFHLTVHNLDDGESKDCKTLPVASREQGILQLGIQRLTQLWQKCVENDGDFVEE